MRAYHNNQEIKDKYVARIKEHIELDHKQYEIELGIPEWLAYVEDRLCKGMTVEKSKTFPLLFLGAINVGADLEKVKAPFMIYILEDALNYFDNEKYKDVTKCINTVIELYKAGETDKEKWKNAACVAAAYVVYAAQAAAAYGVYAAQAAANADVAHAVTYAIGYASAATRSAEDAEIAEAAAHNKYADKLLQLLKECE